MEKLANQITQAAVELSPTSRSIQESSNRWPAPPEGTVKLLLIELLKVSSGPQADKDEMQYGTYRHLLSEVHPHWAARSLKDFLILGKDVNPQHPWRPHPSDIIRHAAKLFRAERLRAAGETPYNPRTGREDMNLSKELSLMRRGAEANNMLEYCAGQIAQGQLKQLEDRTNGGQGRG